MKKGFEVSEQPRTADAAVPKGRMVILAGGGLGLLAGLDAALLRLGLPAPVESTSLASLHGILMLYGFLGTAISLERAVALQSDRKAMSRWAYLSPTFSGLGVISCLVGAANPDTPFARLIPAAAFTMSMLLLTVIYLFIWRRQQTFFLLMQILGSIAGLIGIVLWGRGLEIPVVIPWWTAFLVLTILGERLELARIAFASNKVQVRVFLESLLYFLALTATLFTPTLGYPLMGITLAVLIVDVGAHDIALRTIRVPGLTRLMAACMLTGYAWALVAAGIWTVVGPVWSGYAYDTAVHSLTIGFAFSMVMAHAPIIIPAVARRSIPYHPLQWAVWALLQLGLLVRVIGGARTALVNDDFLVAWQFGGAVDVFTVLIFVITTIGLILWGSRRKVSA